MMSTTGHCAVQGRTETIEEYLSRGGSITSCPASVPAEKPAPVMRVVENHPPKEPVPHDWKPQKGKTKYYITPVMHERIREFYRGNAGKDGRDRLAGSLGIPPWKVTRYAINHGWVAKHPKEPTWSEAELVLLHRWAHLSPPIIRQKMVAAGHNRSATAIMLKLKRTHARAGIHGESATSLAACMGVDSKTIIRAITQGKLPASKRGTDRERDIYYIRWRDIRRYLIDYISEIDIRKVDKFWFVDMLTMGRGE